MVTQYVWDSLASGGGHYIDSLVQVGHNVNLGAGAGDDTVDRFFYALQDQQYNVMALIDENANLVELVEVTQTGPSELLVWSNWKGSDDAKQATHDGAEDSDFA